MGACVRVVMELQNLSFFKVFTLRFTGAIKYLDCWGSLEGSIDWASANHHCLIKHIMLAGSDSASVSLFQDGFPVVETQVPCLHVG